MIKLNKKDITDKIAENKGYSKKETTDIIDEFIKVIEDSLTAGDEINMTGFLKIYSADVPEKSGKVNGKAYVSPAHKTVKVKVGKTLKTCVL